MTNAALRGRAAGRILAAGLLIVAAAVAPALIYRSLASSPSTAAGQGNIGETGPDPTAAQDTKRPSAPGTAGGVATGTAIPRSQPPRALGEADGSLPAGTTAFDRQHPGIGKLDPALLRALREATADAAAVGVDLLVDSGWRSPAYQQQLLEQAISKYGTANEAARWVAPPDTSAHVTGDAVDVGPAAATAWLSANGARYGLCQIYSNEPWHYELRPAAIGRGCPPMYADPTQNPRTHK